MAQWSREALETAFSDKDWLVDIREIQNGVQFKLKERVQVNLFHTGNFSFGGPQCELRSKVEGFVQAGPSQTVAKKDTLGSGNEEIQPTTKDEPRVFVVYGHDIAVREELELILRRVKTNPIILQNIPGKGDTLIEKLESLTNVDFACVLLTPDDIGAAKCKPKDLRPRARQNVVLELGMVLSRLGRPRVAILVKGDAIEKPSDIDGLIYIPFDEKVSEAAIELAATLQDAGFNINVRDLAGS